MISVTCTCGMFEEVPEAQVSKNWLCPSCGKSAHFACAEPLPDGAGAGDFDAGITIVEGPARVGERFLLGGVVDIQLGKLPDKHIVLPGQRVSRNHCVLRRVDFGPSKWSVVDTKSTHGTFVNAERVAERELAPGDRLTIGDFELQYDVEMPAEPPQPEPAMATAHLVGQGHAAPQAAPAHSAAHAAPKLTPYPASHSARPIDYKHAGDDGPVLLGDADIGWVMKLRNASTLMVWVLVINSTASWIGFDIVETLAYFATIFMSIAAAWLLTAREPGVPNSWLSVRAFLRFFAIVGGIGELIVLSGSFMESPDLFEEEVGVGVSSMQLIGVVLAAAVIPQTALFLFYLRRLALRIPNEGLAFCSMLVMVLLPTFMAIMAWSAYKVMTTGEGWGMGLMALLGLLAMRLAYIGLLIWFNKSFS